MPPHPSPRRSHSVVPPTRPLHESSRRASFERPQGCREFVLMSRARLARPMNAVLLFVTVWAACSCGTTTARSAATPSRPGASTPAVAEYPESMRGTWMLGPEPCHLPTSPDADGRFVIEADVISDYEASYKPVRVVPDAGRAGVWHITSIETYLGSQVAEMEHIFILSGTKL